MTRFDIFTMPCHEDNDVEIVYYNTKGSIYGAIYKRKDGEK